MRPYSSVYSFLWQAIKPYKWYYFVMCLAPLITSFYPLANNYAIKVIVDTFSTSSGQISYTNLLYPIGIFIFSQVILDLSWRIGTVASWLSEPYVRCNIILQAYNKIQHYPYNFFQKEYAGSIISKMRGILDGYDDFWDAVHSKLLFRFLTCTISIFALALINIKLFYFMSSWGIIFFTSIYLVSKRLGEISARQTISMHRIFGLLSDNMINIFSIISFFSYNYELKNIKSVIDKDFVPKQVELAKYDFRLQFVANILYWGMLVLLFWFLIHLHINQQITSGQFVFVMGMTLEMSEQLLKMVTQLQDFIKQLSNFQSSFELINRSFTEHEDKEIKDLQLINGNIRFENVSFEYQNNTPVLDNLSFDINHGQKVAIVGPSGCGKSTVVSLLLKYLVPNKGRIIIDNQDILECSCESIRQNIALVPQDIALFHRNIMENIRYGKPEASDEEVVQVAKIANIHNDIQQFPDKYNTILGERGNTLSGGQRQRVAIARAILKNSPILILDEATANLDSKTEESLYKNLQDLFDLSPKTVLFITHNFNALNYMDKIIVLNEGKLAEEGTHNELIANPNGLYYRLWHTQNNTQNFNTKTLLTRQ